MPRLVIIDLLYNEYRFQLPSHINSRGTPVHVKHITEEVYLFTKYIYDFPYFTHLIIFIGSLIRI